MSAAYQHIKNMDQALFLGSVAHVKDDFLGQQIDTSLWTVTGSAIVNPANAGFSGTVGFLSFNAASGQGIQSIFGPRMPIGTGAFRVESRVRGNQGGFTGCWMEWGLLQTPIGIDLGGNDYTQIGPRSTGADWMFLYGPSAVVPTHVQFTGLAPGTGMQTWVFERPANEAYVTVDVGPTRYATVEFPYALGNPGALAFFSMRSSGASAGMTFDYVSVIADTSR